MTGIDKIIKQIESDTQKFCDDIIANAEQKAQKIIANAKLDAAKKSSAIEKQADEKYRDIIARGESSAETEKKKALLYSKQQIITSMIDDAKSFLKQLPDDEYFDLILKLIEKNSANQDGEIAFSGDDLLRLPKDFINKINSVSKGTLTLSSSPININSGFVLIYGGVEENCSFESLFASEYEKLSDKVSHLLF